MRHLSSVLAGAALVACTGARVGGAKVPPSPPTVASNEQSTMPTRDATLTNEGMTSTKEPSGTERPTVPPPPRAPVAPPPAVSAVRAGDSAPRAVPRPTTIRLSSLQGEPEDAELALGDDSFESGDLAQAEKHYEDARRKAPRAVAPLVGLARVRIARVDVPLDYASAKGNRVLVSTAADLARLVARAPAFGPAAVELGRCRLLLGDAAGSLDALISGVRLLPDEPEAHSQLGVALLATGHADKAVRELSRATDLDPGSPARHGNFGTALLMVGRTKEAIGEYEVRANLDERNARAHSDLGTALLGTEDIQRALTELRRAVELEPGRAPFHSNLGYALQQSGQVSGAIAEYREALRLDPKLVSAWINLGTALARDSGTRRQAREAFEHARSLSADDPRVRANLEELDAVESTSSKGLTSPKAIP